MTDALLMALSPPEAVSKFSLHLKIRFIYVGTRAYKLEFRVYPSVLQKQSVFDS